MVGSRSTTVTSSPRRWLVYALGGGLGHVTRSLALARAAVRRGVDVVILTNSEPATALQASAARDGVTLEPVALGAEREATVRAVQERLAEADFDTLLVDTFPRGLAGELALAIAARTAPLVLVHRDLNPAYVRARRLLHQVSLYDLLLAPGELGVLTGAATTVATAPWLVRDHQELLPREQARSHLGAATEGPLVVVVDSTVARERRELASLAAALTSRLAGRAQVRFATTDPGGTDQLHGIAWVRHIPLIELMAGIDLLVGAGGYNTVHEARACDCPLMALARPRRYDRQARRLSSRERVADASAIPNLVERWLRGWRPRQLPSYESGCARAVEAVLALG